MSSLFICSDTRVISSNKEKIEKQSNPKTGEFIMKES